jgi:uncharacterized protein
MHLAGLFSYPVKSCGAIAHERVVLDELGLPWDRRWMVVSEGQFMTQRETPRLALVQPRVSDPALCLNAPGQPELVVPLHASTRVPRPVRIWKDHVVAWDEGDAAAAWFSAWLDQPVRLVRFPDDALRPVNPRYARFPAGTSFSDGYPLLLATDGSLAELNRRLVERGKQPVPMSRFRSNLVVHGAEPFAEDSWRTIGIGSGRFDVVKPSERCSIITLDPTTGIAPEVGEPLATLATFRRWDGGKVIFAQNVIHHGRPELIVGQPITVLETA